MLHRTIAHDLAERPVAAAVLIHLCDYLDHSVDSATVVVLCTARPPNLVPHTVKLMANYV